MAETEPPAHHAPVVDDAPGGGMVLERLLPAEATRSAGPRALEAESRYPRGHTDRVTANALARGAIRAVRGARGAVRRCATLHDIGEVAVPDTIPDKPGRLTPEEYEVVKRHPSEGARIVEPLRSVRDAVPPVRWLHGRMDGRGYPAGLSGGGIPLPVRILSVADVYGAPSSERPYRPAGPHEWCLDVLRKAAAGQGPEVVQSFCAVPAVPPLGTAAAPVWPGEGPHRPEAV